MTDFMLSPGGYVYRALRLLEPRQIGWDVFALQTGLAGIPGFDDLRADGFFGPKTADAVKVFQTEREMDPVDSIAGIATQRKLCQVIARQFRKGWNLPNGLPYGTLEQESGFQVGNHTPPYRDNSRDCGVAQRNTNFAPMEKGFDMPDSLMALCKSISERHAEYVSFKVVDERRAWALAAGAWNRPAYTQALARGQTSVLVNGTRIDLSPGAPERLWIESYIAAVTAYMP